MRKKYVNSLYIENITEFFSHKEIYNIIIHILFKFQV